MFAASAGKVELVRLLLELDVPVRAGEGFFTETALHEACMGWAWERDPQTGREKETGNGQVIRPADGEKVLGH